jgi:hypothetical protein
LDKGSWDQLNQTEIKKNQFDAINAEVMPPELPDIHTNPITKELSQRANRILNEIMVKEEIVLKMVKPSDRCKGFPIETPPLLRRIFEMLPGMFTWAFIFTPFIAAILGLSEILVLYITILAFYWIYRAFRFVYGLYLGVKRTQRDLKVDWIGKIQTECPQEYEKLKYVLIYPIFREGLDTIEPSVAGWANSDVDTQKISLVVAMEEKYAQQCIENFEYIKEKYGHKFREVVYFIHPANIEGEVKGVKGPNINWATRHFVKKVESRGESIKDYLLFTFDCDQIPHKKYISAITYKFLNAKNRYHHFYCSAVHTFNNNLWRVPALVRVFSASLTLVVLHSWTVTKKSRDTWSSYAVSLKTVKEVNYWCPDIENDDTAFYWNALVRFHGDFSGEEVYIPTYNDAVENENYVNTHHSLYKQQHRWGWGIISFPITIAGLCYNREIKLKKRLNVIWTLLDNQLLFLTAVYLITFGIPLLNLFNLGFSDNPINYKIPSIIGYVLLGAFILNVPIVMLRRKIMPVPEGWNWKRNLWDYLETGAVTINMLTFGFIPYLQAQTELLLGKRPGDKLNITEKVIMNSKKEAPLPKAGSVNKTDEINIPPSNQSK